MRCALVHLQGINGIFDGGYIRYMQIDVVFCSRRLDVSLCFQLSEFCLTPLIFIISFMVATADIDILPYHFQINLINTESLPFSYITFQMPLFTFPHYVVDRFQNKTTLKGLFTLFDLISIIAPNRIHAFTFYTFKFLYNALYSIRFQKQLSIA